MLLSLVGHPGLGNFFGDPFIVLVVLEVVGILIMIFLVAVAGMLPGFPLATIMEDSCLL